MPAIITSIAATATIKTIHTEYPSEKYWLKASTDLQLKNRPGEIRGYKNSFVLHNLKTDFILIEEKKIVVFHFMWHVAMAWSTTHASTIHLKKEMRLY